MNLLLKSLILAGIGLSMAQVSAMQKKKSTGKKPGESGNIGGYLRKKYCEQPAAQEKPEKEVDKPGKEDKPGK